jgi:hypothetical protein
MIVRNAQSGVPSRQKTLKGGKRDGNRIVKISRKSMGLVH